MKIRDRSIRKLGTGPYYWAIGLGPVPNRGEANMHKEDAKINCPIFQKQEPAIKDITGKINQARGVQEKAKFAEELQKEVNVLLACPDYKPTSLDCKNCHFIANLRKKTAELIIKAKKLA